MPHGSYAEVIKGPATRLEDTARRLKVDDGLVGVLLRDIEVGGAKDALPLLSFTMERLYLENGGTGRLTVTDYRNLGGIAGSIEEAVEQALTADTDPPIPIDRAARLALLRRGMIPWLADIDPDTGAPRRRVARLSEIPADSHPLLHNLVEQRLLTTDIDKQTGERTIEPAHEALLRQWSLLEGWLTDDTALLAVLEGVKRASRDWAKSNKSTAWLIHAADRLAAAEDLRHRPDLAANLDETNHEYLAVCRTSENERLAAEEEHREAELRNASSNATDCRSPRRRPTPTRPHPARRPRRHRHRRGHRHCRCRSWPWSCSTGPPVKRATHWPPNSTPSRGGVFPGRQLLVMTFARSPTPWPRNDCGSDPAASRGAFYTATTALNTTRVIIPTPDKRTAWR